MTADVIENRIMAGEVVLYRRVSTKSQSDGNYKHQLKSIKSRYPSFSIKNSTVDDIKEVMSGRVDIEKRAASGLGKAIRRLKREHDAIMLVSNADRIARRSDIFTSLQRQGLGKRIYEASTGRCLDQIIKCKQHLQIEYETQNQHRARLKGIADYKAIGGVMGNSCISTQSMCGAEHKRYLAEERRIKVFSTISRMVCLNSGKRPSLPDICAQLNKRGIRTGQGRFFTSMRLSQFKKSNLQAWHRAINSYRRHRRRKIRLIVGTVQTEFRTRRNRQRAMKRLMELEPTAFNIQPISAFEFTRQDFNARLPHYKFHTGYSCDGCRGPPLTCKCSNWLYGHVR